MSTGGRYTYWCNDVEQPIEEPWSLRTGKAGHLLRGQRLVNGNPVLIVEAQYQAGHCTGLKLLWHSDHRSLKVYYRKDGNKLYWRYSGDREERLLDLEEGSELFPVLRAGTGPLLTHLARSKRPVVLPNMGKNIGFDEMLAPMVTKRHAVLQSFNNETSHYRYHATEFGAAGSDCWIDEQSVLQRLRWNSGAGGVWEVRLEDLEAGKQFKGFGAV